MIIDAKSIDIGSIHQMIKIDMLDKVVMEVHSIFTQAGPVVIDAAARSPGDFSDLITPIQPRRAGSAGIFRGVE